MEKAGRCSICGRVCAHPIVCRLCGRIVCSEHQKNGICTECRGGRVLGI